MELYLIIQFNNNSSDIFLMTSLKLLIMKMNHSDESVLIILLVYIRAYLQIDNYVTKNDRTANTPLNALMLSFSWPSKFL